jgi:hypothetical protein
MNSKEATAFSEHESISLRDDSSVSKASPAKQVAWIYARRLDGWGVDSTDIPSRVFLSKVINVIQRLKNVSDQT